MGDVVNLRRLRKAKTRTEAETRASENRAAFGTPKSERSLRAAQADLAARKQDGHKLDPPTRRLDD